jgi:hypothetical protein
MVCSRGIESNGRPCSQTATRGTTDFLLHYQRGFQEGTSEMKTAIAIASALLLSTGSLALAQTTKSGTASPGASQYSPGHEMQHSKTNKGPGASEYAPGDRMHDKGTVGQSKGASRYSPGDRMNDKRK